LLEFKFVGVSMPKFQLVG